MIMVNTNLLSLAGSSKQRRQPLSVTPAPDVSSSTPAAPPASSTPTPQQQQLQQQLKSQASTEAPADAGAAATVAAQPDLFKLVSRRVLKELASLPRAIGIMAVITALSALGTVIPQNKVREAAAAAPWQQQLGRSSILAAYNIFSPVSTCTCIIRGGGWHCKSCHNLPCAGCVTLSCSCCGSVTLVMRCCMLCCAVLCRVWTTI
jgi:hypothetical protein